MEVVRILGCLAVCMMVFYPLYMTDKKVKVLYRYIDIKAAIKDKQIHLNSLKHHQWK